MELLRPGCGGIPTFTFVTKYWFTLLFMLFAALMLFLACLCRLCVHITSSRRRQKNLPESSYAIPTRRSEEEEDDTIVNNKDNNNNKEERQQRKDDEEGNEKEKEGETHQTEPADTPKFDFIKRSKQSALILLSISTTAYSPNTIARTSVWIQPDLSLTFLVPSPPSPSFSSLFKCTSV